VHGGAAPALAALGAGDFAQLSLLSDFELASMQLDSFTLATLEFQAIGLGTSSLDFVFDAFNDIKGLGAGALDVDPVSGSVTVSDPAIPEPSAALVFALGMLIVGAATRSRKIRARVS
jgi:hypothetical protein